MGNPATRREPFAVVGVGEAVEIRLSLRDHRGVPVLDCRAFDRITSTGIYTTTARGFPIRLDQLRDLSDAISRAALAAQAGTLVGGEG